METPEKQPLSKRFKILLALMAGVSTFVIALSFYFYQIFYTPNILVSKKEAVGFIITKEMTFNQVVDTLKKYDALNDETSFRFVARLLKYSDRIKEGYYKVKHQQTNLEVIRMLRSGAQTPVHVTLSNARTKRDIANKICKNLRLDSMEVLKMLNAPAIVQKYGFDTTTIVCMFIPNTYQMYYTTSAEDLLDRMSKEYKKFWNDKRKKQAESMSMTPIQVAVLGSIVEAETNHNDEKARIAGVYLNRLKLNMPLQADPTVVFGIGDFGIKRVLRKHLDMDSPYNTYKNIGLPPGPIRVVSGVGIDAVLNAEKHDYIFFCAKEDFSGYHNFAVTLAEHNQNAQKYQMALDKAGY